MMECLLPYSDLGTTLDGICVLEANAEDGTVKIRAVQSLSIFTMVPKTLRPKAIADHLLATTIYVPHLTTIVAQISLGDHSPHAMILDPLFMLEGNSVEATLGENWPAISLLDRRLNQLVLPKAVVGNATMLVDVAQNPKPIKDIYYVLLQQSKQ